MQKRLPRIPEEVLRSGLDGSGVGRAQLERVGGCEDRGPAGRIVGHLSGETAEPGPVKVNVAALIVVGFIAVLKLATATVFGHMLFVPSGGPMEITIVGPGCQAVTPGVKLETTSLASAFPDRSTAAVVTVAV
jgi:hypothetical protein